MEEGGRRPAGGGGAFGRALRSSTTRVPPLLARGRPVLRAHPPPLARRDGAGLALTAVGLALLSALLFGGMSVGLRIGLSRPPRGELATICTVAGALAVALVAAIAEA